MTENHNPTKELVAMWMETFADRPVHYTHVCDNQFLKDERYHPHLRRIMQQLKKEGKIEPVGSRDGLYRWVDDSAKPITWWTYEPHSDSGLLLPFNLRDYVFIYPDTTIIVAGEKSSGKTGFIYKTLTMNMFDKNCKLLTNLEGGIAMLKDRFFDMDIELPIPPPFDVLFVADNYQDYIKEPNTIYLIDYIDVGEESEFYKIAAQIKKVDRKLQGLNSNAIIGLQKPPGRDAAYGGFQTMKVATLYIAMSSNKLKIVDAKVPADKKVHPKNMTWTFVYDQSGTNFLNITPSFEEDR